MEMRAKVLGLGVKYGGRCVVCGCDTGSRAWELAQTMLLRYDDGHYGVAHPVCCHAKVKTRVGGGVVLVDAPSYVDLPSA
jgi:hypothetical protein